MAIFNISRFGRVFLRYARGQTDRQTDRPTDRQTDTYRHN